MALDKNSRQERNIMLVREREAVLANLRSEFSTPLDVIVGYTQILLDELRKYHLGSYAEYLNKILQAGQILQTSVDEIFSFANITTKKEDFDFKNFSSKLQFNLLTPLSSIIGYCELILEDDFTAEQERFLDDVMKIHQSSKLFINYINEIDRLTQVQWNGTDLLAQFKDSNIVIHDVITSIPPIEKGFVYKPPIHTGSILVVEDNLMASDLLIRRVTHYGFTAVACQNPKQALDKLDVGNFDLILLQIVMSSMSGFEILKQIKEHRLYRYLPVIVISPLKEIDSIVRCFELGADDYLTKPFNPIIFKARIAACIEKKFLQDKEKEYLTQLKVEKTKSENLLLNIVPSTIAERLKRGDASIVDKFASVTIIFIDIVGFSRLAEEIEPSELIKILNTLFSMMDKLTDKYHLEKIKTIGDSYMAVSGAPVRNEYQAEAVADFALDVFEELKLLNEELKHTIQIRVGIHSGPVIAGVIGKKKFMYDLWGGSVNIASRLEEQGLINCIQTSESTYNMLKQKFEFKKRGTILAPGIGKLNTYLLLKRK